MNKDHLTEIFGNFGVIKYVDLPNERGRNWLHKGMAYIEFEKADEAADAVKHMDKGNKHPGFFYSKPKRFVV